jgi:hypothetical protein
LEFPISGKETKFPGVSITNFGVIKDAGFTTANGAIHADNSFNLADLEHEYGHFLQALNYGESIYNGVIIPASLYSMTFDSENHKNFWTEKDANALATEFFGDNSAIGRDNNNFPKEYSSLILIPIIKDLTQ